MGNWTLFSPTGARVSYLAFGGGTAVGYRVSTGTALTASSTAVTTSITAGGTVTPDYDISFGNGIWHIPGDADTHRIAYSTNGSSWATALNVTAQTGDLIRTVGYGNGLWIAPVSGDNDVYTSTSGTAFTIQNSVLASGQWTDATWNGSVYGVYNSSNFLGGGGTAYYTSTNGTTWTARTLPATPTSQVTAGSGVVMYVASGGVVYTSSSGTAFAIAGTAPNSLYNLSNSKSLLEFGAGVWVYAGKRLPPNDGTALSYYSSDNGATWSTATFSSPITSNSYDLAFNSTDSAFYMVTDNGATTDVYKASVS